MSKTYIPVALRKQVRLRAHEICEYCLLPEWVGFENYHIDHVISEKHAGATEADNLALSCRVCNLRKGSDIATLLPDNPEPIPLYHPRRDQWHLHFTLREDGKLVGLTEVGSATINLLQLNAPNTRASREVLLAGEFEIIPRHLN